MKRWFAAAVAVPVLTTMAVPLALVVGGGAALSVLNSGTACAGTTQVAGVTLSASGRFTAEQRSIAATASMVADQRHLPARAKVIILAVGFQESGVRNLDHGDRDSVGWLQQRAGWGPVSERMNPGVAAGKFYDHLLRVPGWSSLPVTVAAQRVQVSGFPGAYAKWESAAGQLLASITGGAPVPAAAAVAVTATATGCAGGDVFGDLQLIAVLNPQGAGNWQGAVQSGPYWYVAHATAGDRTQVFHRLNARGAEIDQMTAVGFMHATSFAAAGNTVYATDGHWNVVSFPYRPGATIRSGTPTGWRGYISKDPTGNAVVIRNGNHYRAYNAATRQPIGVEVRTDPGQRQGFSISGTTLYVLTGPTNQPARVDSYSFTTGAKTGTRDITSLGAAEAGSHREPEGMYGAMVGVKTNTGTRRRLRVYAFAPAATMAVGGYRTVSGIRIPIPKGPAGVAVNYALSQVGKPYVWAAHGPDAFDCSGLTGQAWIHAGVNIPQQSDAQNRALRHVPVSQAQPGDILWHPGHVQIFLGVIGGRWTVVEAANPRAGIRVDQSHWMGEQAVLRP